MWREKGDGVVGQGREEGGGRRRRRAVLTDEEEEESVGKKGFLRLSGTCKGCF
jgi:hypothetical protein